MTDTIAEVALPIPRRSLFDYLLPKEAGFALQPGCRVSVPFGQGVVTGIFIGTKSTSPWPLEKLKAIISCLDETPVFDELSYQWLRWASDYYQYPLGEVFHTGLPVKLRQSGASTEPAQKFWRCTLEGAGFDAAELTRAPKQQQVLQLLQQQPQLAAALNKDFGRSVLEALAKKQLVESYEAVAEAKLDWYLDISVGDKPQLSQAQALACSAINQSIGKFSGILLEGVTGSGKTEVYLQVLEPLLKQGIQGLVLVPEIGLTPQTVRRFQTRFNIEIGVLHSGMTDTERLKVWFKARSGELGLVIGTRSAIFTPFKQLGLVIIDEEHDNSYKQQEGFRYHARDLAAVRAKMLKIPLLLGSATPSLESLNNALQKRYLHLQLQERAGEAAFTRQRLLDIKQQPLEFGIATATKAAMLQHLQQGNQVLVFLNRRGYAPLMQCHSCGHVENCHHCDHPYTVHWGEQRLRCHHCGASKRLLHQCSQCHSQEVSYSGLGTEQLEQGLKRLFPQYPTVRIDSDALRSKQALQTLLTAVAKREYQILLGTQILAKGHHFPDVTLVVMLDIDSGLFSADFRAPEHLGQLLTQLAGRAGRAAKSGEMWLQTHHPDHPLLQDLIHNGYQHFSRYALAERRQALLPPFSYQALIRAEAEDPQRCHDYLMQARQLIQPDTTLVAVGPLPAPMAKKQGRYRAQLLVQSNNRAYLQAQLKQKIPLLESLPGQHKVRWSVDVDPQDFS